MLTEDFQGFLWHNIIQLQTIGQCNYEFIIVCMTLKKIQIPLMSNYLPLFAFLLLARYFGLG